MRWLIFFSVLLFGCGTRSQVSSRDTLPGIELVHKIDSMNRAERGSAMAAGQGLFHSLTNGGCAATRFDPRTFARQHLLRKVLVDTVQLETAAGQMIVEELWENKSGYWLVIGGDTIRTQCSSLHKEDGTQWYDENFDEFLRDSTLHFYEPLKVIHEENLDELASLPDKELLSYGWIVRYPTFDSTGFCFCAVKFLSYQLDEDEQQERIARLSGESGMGVYVWYEVFDDVNGNWKRLACVPAFDHNGECDDPIFYQWPYFGFYDHGWGSCFGSRSLTVCKLEKGKVYYWLDIFDQKLFACTVGFENGGEEWYGCNVQWINGELHLDYSMKLIAYSASDSIVPMLDSAKVRFTMLPDTVLHRFVVKPQRNYQWLSVDYADNTVMLDEGKFKKAKLKPLAKHGTPEQRKVLSGYQW